jgi:hypothetical protein
MQVLYAGLLARTSFTLVLLGIAGAMALALRHRYLRRHRVCRVAADTRARHSFCVRRTSGAAPVSTARWAHCAQRGAAP